VLGEHSVVSHLTVDEFDARLEPDL
jgi:hypothetical protein